MFKKIQCLIFVGAIILSFVACSKPTTTAKVEDTAVNSVPQTQAQVNNNIPAEYKQVTTNENGVKIYGKIVDANTASDVGKKVIQDNAFDDKEIAREGLSVTYSEYYSESYGGMVILRTDNKDGSQNIYNENGQRFMSGEAKYELEQSLAKYRLGNAMAEAIDRKVSGK